MSGHIGRKRVRHLRLISGLADIFIYAMPTAIDRPVLRSHDGSYGCLILDCCLVSKRWIHATVIVHLTRTSETRYLGDHNNHLW